MRACSPGTDCTVVDSSMLSIDMMLEKRNLVCPWHMCPMHYTHHSIRRSQSISANCQRQTAAATIGEQGEARNDTKKDNSNNDNKYSNKCSSCDCVRWLVGVMVARSVCTSINVDVNGVLGCLMWTNSPKFSLLLVERSSSSWFRA